jgi:NAD(P)-dependent dehydrogenase (short-subunit alcohol dehydrogenase family)
MKTIVIIGGNKGIGKAILEQQIENHLIVSISRNEPDFEHKNLTHYQLDVLKDELPDLEIVDQLVYCPGSINLKPFNRLKLEDFSSEFEINVLGAIKVIQKYLPQLKAGNNPSILLFSTVAAKLGMPFHASIAVAKSGVEGLVKSLGAEFASTIRINAIAPTLTNTDLSAHLLRNETAIENMVQRHPMKKILQPNEVADMADFLLSEKSKSISGQVFELDCGIVSFKI